MAAREHPLPQPDPDQPPAPMRGQRLTRRRIGPALHVLQLLNLSFNFFRRIAWFSGDTWGAAGPGMRFLRPLLVALLPHANLEQIAGAVWLVRKCAHVTEYAILAGLWRWAFARRGSPSWRVPLALSVLTAALVFVARKPEAIRVIRRKEPQP